MPRSFRVRLGSSRAGALVSPDPAAEKLYPAGELF
jgi:hypothetical protein